MDIISDIIPDSSLDITNPTRDDITNILLYASGVVSGMLGIVCLFYLPVVEIIVTIDIGFTIDTAEQLNVQDVREQIKSINGTAPMADIGIILLPFGSLICALTIWKKELLLIGSSVQSTGLLLIYYDSTTVQGGSSLIGSVSVDPTVWLYGLVVAIALSFILGILTVVKRYIRIRSD